MKRKPGSKTTTVEFEKYDVIRELCAVLGISLKEYLNRLIREDIARNRNEYFNLRYFKGMAGRI